MRVLVTNDDGIDSVGIHRLAVALDATGHFDVVVVAPDHDASGTGASLGGVGTDGLAAHRVALPDAPHVEAWGLNAPPAMCVLTGRLGGFGEVPDLIVSGINAGLNTGRAVLHSGTVGAALTAQNFGCSGLAVSLAEGDPWHWDTAAELAARVAVRLVAGPERSVLNLNVPNRPLDDVRGVRWARLAPFGEVRMTVTPADHDDLDGDGSGRPGRRLAAELVLSEVTFDPDTDTGLVREGWATLTTLVGVSEAWPGVPAPPSAEPPVVSGHPAPGAPVEEVHEIPDASRPGNLHRPVAPPAP